MAPFPTLAYFAIWNRKIATGERDEHDEEDAGVLYFGTKLELSPFRRARKVGLAQGLVDFTRMLSTSEDSLRAVHSSQQRMLFFEAEQDFCLHAVRTYRERTASCAVSTAGQTIDLARVAPAKDRDVGHVRSTSQGSEKVPPGVTAAASDEGLEDAALLANLRDLYEQFRLLNGTMAAILADQGRHDLEKRLATYFDEAIWRWHIEQAVLGVCDLAGVLGALAVSPGMATMALSPALASLADRCVLLHFDEVLYIPEDRQFRPLARHLVRKQPKRHKEKPPDPVPSKSPDPSASVASKWTLGLSDYLVAAPRPEKPPEVAQETSSARSWLRVVSWGSSKEPALDETADGKPTSESSRDTVADDSDDSSEIAEHIARQVIGSSADNIAPEIVIDDSDAQVYAEDVDDTVDPVMPGPFEPPDRVFIGDRWRYTYVMRQDALLLAVLGDEEPNADLATQLMSAAENVILACPKPTLVSDHRHMILDRTRSLQRSAEWPSVADSWSGNTRSGKEADVIGSLLEFAGDSKLDEALVRTGSGQWAAARRAAAGSAAPEVYLVLPRRFGRDAAEGSLLDAAHELNVKLGRAMV